MSPESLLDQQKKSKNNPKMKRKQTKEKPRKCHVKIYTTSAVYSGLVISQFNTDQKEKVRPPTVYCMQTIWSVPLLFVF